MRQKFDGSDGKVVFIEVEPVTFNYPEGTLKVEVSIYPVGSGKYSSFIYTQAFKEEIESKMYTIAEEFLNTKQGAFSSGEISSIISKYIIPTYPIKN